MALMAEVEIQCTVRVDIGLRRCQWKATTEDLDEAAAMLRAHHELKHTNADRSPRR